MPSWIGSNRTESFITKHGKPIARLVPVEANTKDLIGCLKGKIKIKGDILSTGLW